MTPELAAQWINDARVLLGDKWSDVATDEMLLDFAFDNCKRSWYDAIKDQLEEVPK